MRWTWLGLCVGLWSFAAQAELPEAWDPELALRRLSLDACGRSPTPLERQTGITEAGLKEVLDGCLRSEHWIGKDGVLWSLAHPKIRPLQAIKSGEDAGSIPLADYEDDYNLFVYTHFGDRDAREVLTANYVVRRVDEPSTQYTAISSSTLEELSRGASVAQLVQPERRAGMLTTRWNLASNTMFTAIPRTTAAQAYRAWLGYDLSRYEGLFPVQGEPIDYDAKDVKPAACAVCHSTLDPLTYPFAHYNGIGGGSPGGVSYRYELSRPGRFQATDGPLVGETPEFGYLMGSPVADLVEWARVAADSEAFARASAADLWGHFLKRPPEGPEFEEVWRRFVQVHEYRVDALVWDIVRTEAYGGF
ncbi:MAG: hypothetical protein AAF627_13815 [Myxococcota bacterium]